MNKQAVLLGALAGLIVQIGAGSVMGILWVGGNVRGVLTLLIIAALASAFTCGVVAAVIAGRKQITHGVAAALILLVASTINNIFTGHFHLVWLFAGVALAPAMGCLGAGAVALARTGASRR
jgi:hypothetical protein